MRDLVGEAWEDSLTDNVFHALFVKKKRGHPKPTEVDIKKCIQEGRPFTVAWLPRDFLSGWITDALNSKDAGFFERLAKSMKALNKVWPDGINEPIEPADKWRWTAARFIKKHWDKHGCATSQQALREHLESKKMEDYHANLFHLLEVAAEETPSGIPESIRVLALASNEADSGIPANELHLVMASLMEGAKVTTPLGMQGRS